MSIVKAPERRVDEGDFVLLVMERSEGMRGHWFGSLPFTARLIHGLPAWACGLASVLVVSGAISTLYGQ